ncbi:MAG: DUF4159 domain-containing protein [Isosphaeraceae bacterium]
MIVGLLVALNFKRDESPARMEGLAGGGTVAVLDSEKRVSDQRDAPGPPREGPRSDGGAEPPPATPPAEEGERAQAPEPESRPGEAMPDRRLSPLGERVESAIRAGVAYLKRQQRPDGSWLEVEPLANSGTTSLVTIALLAAGEMPDSPAVRKALTWLRDLRPDRLRNTYAIALQTVAFAAAEPDRDRPRLLANVEWLEMAQIKPNDRMVWPGTWTYTDAKLQAGDNSNTQYALLALDAASEVGVPVNAEVWTVARKHWEETQTKDGSWTYTPRHQQSTASMTCAGISSLLIARDRMPRQARSVLMRDAATNCGDGRGERNLQGGIDWLTRNFTLKENFGFGQPWRFYYFHDLERVGRLAGARVFGPRDWYQLGAEELVRDQNPLSGFWRGIRQENELIATSYALLFLVRGRAPVLIHKLRHLPADDWDNDPDDVRNLVDAVSRDWKSRMSWQVADSATAIVSDLLRAPILFINGHRSPELAESERIKLREYVEQGGVIFAEACCGKGAFDRGFRALIKEIFPAKESELRRLPGSHPLWRARRAISPDTYPLWGIERDGKLSVIYSPKDLSCAWDRAQREPSQPDVIESIRLGQNVIDHVTGRKPPPDKLSLR